MIDKIISDFLEQGEKVAKYRQAVELLKQSGFFDFIRKFGYPDILDHGNNAQSMALQAGISHGFQRAVTHMEFFYEMYALKQKPTTAVPSFGAEKIVIKDKLLTKEELEKIKGGKI